VPPVDAVQVVHDVAAADDAHAPFTQRCEPRRETEVVVHRLGLIDRQLQDRDIGDGKGMAQHRPGAMVDAPAFVVEPHPLRLDDLRDLSRDIGRARGRIVDREQLVREAVEVVDRARARHRRHRRGIDIPVRGDHQYRSPSADGITESAPRFGVAVVGQGVHQVAVSEERGGRATDRHGQIHPAIMAPRQLGVLRSGRRSRGHLH
jgi:hypothetical protein